MPLAKSNSKELKDVALYEYSGEFKNKEAAHGNA